MGLTRELLFHRWPELRERAPRVEKVCRLLGEALRLRDDEAFALDLAAQFHDVGLLGCPQPDAPMPPPTNRPASVDLQLHTQLSATIVHRAFSDFPDAIEAIWYHHERPDGLGPYRLTGSQIPLLAGVLSLADALDFMVHPPGSDSPCPCASVVTEVEEGSGSRFLTNVAGAFLCAKRPLYEALTASIQAVNEDGVSPAPAEASEPGPSRCAEAPRRDAAPSGGGRAVPDHGGAPSGGRQASSASSASSASLREMSAIIERQALIDRVVEGLELRPFPATAKNVLTITSNSRCSVDDVARVILQDQALSVRLLQLANSSAYSRGHPVDGVKEAVGRLGVAEVRHVVMALGIMERYGGGIAEKIDPRMFWEHAIATALIAAELGQRCLPKQCDGCFLWGLLHDVGRLVMLEHCADLYAEVWDASRRAAAPLERVEKKMLHMDHGQILERVLRHWNFPREMIAPVTSHHHPVDTLRRLAPSDIKPAALVALANRLAHALAMGNSGNETLYPVEDLAELLGIPTAELPELLVPIEDQTRDLRCLMLARGGFENWPDVCEGYRRQLPKALRPLCVSADPPGDAYRMFFERLAEGPMDEDTPPNLGVMYLRDAREGARLVRELLERADSSGVSDLPVVVICRKGDPGPATEALSGRDILQMNTPVHIPALLEGLGGLPI